MPLPPDVSGADGRGVVRLCVLGVSIRVLRFWLPIELEMSRLGDTETLPEDGDSLCGALNTLSDRHRLGGVNRRVPKSRAGSRLGAGEEIKGSGGLVERGALGVNDGREGAIGRGALGVNDGLEGAVALGGLNDGLDGTTEGDLPELEGALGRCDGEGLGLAAWRLAPMF